MKEKTSWDKIAKEKFKSKPNNVWCDFYIKNFYYYYVDKTIEAALLHSKKQKIKILKTDLWDETVNTKSRDVIRRIIARYKNKIKVYSIDISKEIISTLKKKKESDFDYRIGDIRKLPFPKNSFDVILDLSTLDHIKPGEIRRVYSEYDRCLKPKGYALLIFWHTNNPFATAKRALLWLFKKEKYVNEREAQFYVDENKLIRWFNLRGYHLIYLARFGVLLNLVQSFINKFLDKVSFAIIEKLCMKERDNKHFKNLYPLTSIIWKKP